MKKKLSALLALVLCAMLVLAVVFTWVSGIFSQSNNSIPYSQVVSLFQGEQVKSFVEPDSVEADMKVAAAMKLVKEKAVVVAKA